MTVDISLIISTKNRRDDLATALASALEQTVRAELVVIDDGSTDGTAEMVREKFPAAKLVRSEHSQGYIVQRTLAASIATGRILFSMDDDAALSHPRILETTLAEFDDAFVGAVAVPFVNVKQSPAVRQRAPDGEGTFVSAQFVGTAHGLRRDIFLRLGGYRAALFHQGEERDYCIRLLAAGYAVRLGRAEPIHHFESPKRDFRRMDVYGRRNDVLFGWHNVPLPHLPGYLAATIAGGLVHGVRMRRMEPMVHGITRGLADMYQQRHSRAPVSTDVYRLHRRLRRARTMKLDDIRNELQTFRDRSAALADVPVGAL